MPSGETTEGSATYQLCTNDTMTLGVCVVTSGAIRLKKSATMCIIVAAPK